MLTTLESASTTASVTRNKRESLVYEMENREALAQNVLKQQVDKSITQANALAGILSEQPSLKDRASLIRLAKVVGADYLMLFDKSGNEVCASNTLTGLRVTDASRAPLSEFQPVLHGHPYVVGDPITDEESGTTTHAVASLITNAEGLADGFLVLSVDDTAVIGVAELDSLESVVGGFATLANQVAFVVDDKSGKFLAHTDPTLSGLDAGDYVGADLIGRNFEGFSDYMGSYSYVSEVTRDERSVMVVSRDVLSALTTTTNVELFCLPIIVLFALYYLIACPLVARHPMAMDERTMRGSPLRVFGFGYVIYFCALALVSARLSSRGAWPSFDFVFARHWANGVHLFSLIYALFFVSRALVVAYVLRSVLAHVGPANTHAKTLVRLTHSLVGYMVALVLLFGLLSLFGVDTATLLASAGIVSIAIGMGAKDLVTDVLAGLFLIFEGAIHVGDIVEVGSWHGRVTDMGIRTCSITNENNDVKIITNSNVSDIVNKSLSKSISTFEFEIKRDVEIDGVEGLVRRYIDRAVADIPELASTLEYAGIVGLTDDAYTVRLVFACNEDRRESLSTRLGTTMKLILEGVTAQEGTAKEVQAENE